METKIFRNGDLPKGLVFCNFKSAKTDLPAADSLPILVKDETGKMERYFTASAGMERNDAVPFEGGAMPQQVNSKNDYEQAKDLIRNGQVNYTDPLEGDEFIHDGKVYRSVLRRMASHANADAGVKELISLIDKGKNRKGKKPMDKEELFGALRGLYMNGLVSMADIADGIGSTAPEVMEV